MTPALLSFGIFGCLVTAWWLWPETFWPAPDPEEGSGDVTAGVGAPEPSPVIAEGGDATCQVPSNSEKLADAPEPACDSAPSPTGGGAVIRYAYRHWNVDGGGLASPLFHRPEDAGAWRADTGAEDLTFVRIEDGWLCSARSSEVIAAICEAVA